MLSWVGCQRDGEQKRLDRQEANGGLESVAVGASVDDLEGKWVRRYRGCNSVML